MDVLYKCFLIVLTPWAGKLFQLMIVKLVKHFDPGVV